MTKSRTIEVFKMTKEQAEAEQTEAVIEVLRQYDRPLMLREIMEKVRDMPTPLLKGEYFYRKPADRMVLNALYVLVRSGRAVRTEIRDRVLHYRYAPTDKS